MPEEPIRSDWVCEIWLVAIDAPVDPAEVRRHWNVKETPVLDALAEKAPSIRLGMSEVPLPESDGRRGPVGRVVDLLGYVGTTPDYVLPVIDDGLVTSLLQLLDPVPGDPPFEVVEGSQLESFLREHAGAHLMLRG